MNPELQASLPFLILAIAAVAVMLMIALRRHHGMTATAASLGLLAALMAIGPALRAAPEQITPLFLVDGFTLFFLALLLAAALAVLALSHAYLNQLEGGPVEEYYLLLLLATLGAAALLASTHFVAFFLGLETLSIALIGLIAYPLGRERSLEAGLKYLVLAGVSSAFLLFGVALLYLDTGTMSFAALGRLWAASPPDDLYTFTGFALLLTGIGFKLSLVPFHMWAPDIYEGAPTPIAAFVAVISKIAIFALLLRFFAGLGGYQYPSLLRVVTGIAILSMLAGNLLALLQNNVKRILAYSSIAHFGYVLVAFLAGGSLAFTAAGYYLSSYAVTTIGAFGVVTLLSEPGSGVDADRLESYRGLMWSRPWLTGAFTVLLLSLAGLPPTMGFIAEVYVMASGVGRHLFPALAALVAGSAIGLYYYLRIIVVLLSPRPGQAPFPVARQLSPTGGATLCALVVLVLGLGLYPVPLLAVIGHDTEAVASAGGPAPPALRTASLDPSPRPSSQPSLEHCATPARMTYLQYCWR